MSFYCQGVLQASIGDHLKGFLRISSSPQWPAALLSASQHSGLHRQPKGPRTSKVSANIPSFVVALILKQRCDPCFSSPCQHGGLCLKGSNPSRPGDRFTCQCNSLYTGNRFVLTKIASKVEIVIADVKLEGTLVWTHLVEMGAVADLAGGRLVDSSFLCLISEPCW